MASVDIRFAFDSMIHSVVVEALLAAEIHPYLIEAFLRELRGLSATMYIRGVGLCE